MDTTLDDMPEKPEEKKPKEEKIWVEDEPESDAEVVKLQVGDNLEGLFTDKFHSTKWNADCYKIKPVKDEKTRIIVATTILQKMMMNKEIGTEVKIERMEDTTNAKGQSVQNWKTYHLK